MLGWCRRLAPGQERPELLDGAHQRGREHHRGVLVRDLDQALEVAQLQGQRMGHHHVGGRAELVGGQGLAFGGDDLGPLLAFGLGLAGHGPFHGLGELDVFELDQGHHHPQSSVVRSRISRMSRLMRSVSASVWSRVCWPTTLRRVVWAIWLMAAATFSMATTDLVASTTW